MKKADRISRIISLKTVCCFQYFIVSGGEVPPKSAKNIFDKRLELLPNRVLRKFESYMIQLSNGYWVNVNRSIPRLMDHIQALCLHCGYQKNQVRIYGVKKGESVAQKTNIAAPQKGAATITFEVIEAPLISSGLNGLLPQELIDQLQLGIAPFTVQNLLEQSGKAIAMPHNRYVHVDSFVDLDEAEEDLDRILNSHFALFDGYSNYQLLFGAASQEMSLFINDNDCGNPDAIYAIARYLFGKKYTFSAPHIFRTKPDYPMTLRGLMIHRAKSNGGILYNADAKSYLQKTMLTYGGIGQLLQIGSSNTFLMYDDERYLLSEAIGIDEAWCIRMHDRVDDLFRKANVAYVIPRDISSSSIPDRRACCRALLCNNTAE